MSIENLWPGNLQSSNIETPKIILKRQAEYLSQETDGILEGFVDSTRASFSHSTFVSDSELVHTLKVIAPMLDGYVVSLLAVNHTIDIYPCTVEDKIGNLGKRDANTVHDLKEILRDLFQSEKIRMVISSLYSQSLD